MEGELAPCTDSDPTSIGILCAVDIKVGLLLKVVFNSMLNGIIVYFQLG